MYLFAQRQKESWISLFPEKFLYGASLWKFFLVLLYLAANSEIIYSTLFTDIQVLFTIYLEYG